MGSRMMQKRVYIETTIPSFYYTSSVDTESIARMNWTHQWWQEYAGQFRLVSSPAVIAELRRGIGEKRELRIALFKDIELLEITDEV